MADLYNTVKKQGEQIDDLQKNVSNHSTRIEILETQAKAIPPPTQPTLPKEIKVELPPDIATNSRIGRMLDEKLSKISGDENLKKCWSNCQTLWQRVLPTCLPTILALRSRT